MKRRNFKISGLSILEALVSTAIVGIGFIAILQMTNFSVQSIDRSADRTKANYLTEMIAEDVLAQLLERAPPPCLTLPFPGTSVACLVRRP